MIDDLSLKRRDALILGGGLGGFAAAMTLAGEGRKVLIIEPGPCLGRETSAAFDTYFPTTDSGVAALLLTALEACGGRRGEMVDPAITEITLDRLAEEAAIEVLFYSRPLDIAVRDDRAVAVMVAGRGGRFPIEADLFIDATEEAVAWRGSGLGPVPEDKVVSGQALLFHGLKEEIPSPLRVEGLPGTAEVVVLPSVWPGEAWVRFFFEGSSPADARLLLPDLVARLRERVPQLAEAGVALAGFEPFPVQASCRAVTNGLRHPTLTNLFAAGPWAVADEAERRRACTPTGRMHLGEETAALALDVLPDACISVAPVEPDAEVAAIEEADVIVAGGGTAGPLAAVAAARRGARTVLLEAGTILGGIGTAGGVSSYFHGLPGGLQDEVDARTDEMEELFRAVYPGRSFHPSAKAVVLEQMCREAGVKVVYHSLVTGVDKSGNRVTGVRADSPSGIFLYRGGVVIDATGDGDVAALAGAAFSFGRELDGLPNACSQPCGRFNSVGLVSGENFDSGFVDPSHSADLTRARRQGVSLYRHEKYENDSRPVYIAPLIGLRQSRQIKGDYVLTFDDIVHARGFDDCVGYMNCQFDPHATDFENERDEIVFWVKTLGFFRRVMGYEVPYRCLLPAGLEGLLVACRALSVTSDAGHVLRMQNDMQRLGEAAGIAAALAVRQGTTPRKVDISELRRELRLVGALQDEHRPVASVAEGVEPSAWKRTLLAGRPEALWGLAMGGDDAVPVLLELLEGGPEELRLPVAVALGMHGRTEAVPPLLDCLASSPEAKRPAPREIDLRLSAIVMLGRIGDRRALPVLLRMIQDPAKDFDELSAAIRAVGRIGDTSAIPTLEALLKREDLPGLRYLSGSSVLLRQHVREDALWQLRLGAVAAMAALGSPRPDLARPFLADPRACVRNHARRVLEGI